MKKKLTGYILAIDFEKAYDSLGWGFLWKTLQAFGFPQIFIRYIQTAYKNIEACVINGGTTTRYFKQTRGVRQGDPISSYLFILALELLLIKIRKNGNIKGIKINGFEIKTSAYADDMTNFLQDPQSIIELFKELDLFSSVSGLKCNAEKTEVLKIGAIPNPIENVLNLKYVDTLTVTGIVFTRNNQGTISKNANTILEKNRQFAKPMEK